VIVEVNMDSERLLNDLIGLRSGRVHGVGDHSWMDAFAEKLAALGEECTAENNDTGGAVTSLDVLAF
jgi:hypothetical protein